MDPKIRDKYFDQLNIIRSNFGPLTPYFDTQKEQSIEYFCQGYDPYGPKNKQKNGQKSQLKKEDEDLSIVIQTLDFRDINYNELGSNNNNNNNNTNQINNNKIQTEKQSKKEYEELLKKRNYQQQQIKQQQQQKNSNYNQLGTNRSAIKSAPQGQQMLYQNNNSNRTSNQQLQEEEELDVHKSSKPSKKLHTENKDQNIQHQQKQKQAIGKLEDNPCVISD